MKELIESEKEIIEIIETLKSSEVGHGIKLIKLNSNRSKYKLLNKGIKLFGKNITFDNLEITSSSTFKLNRNLKPGNVMMIFSLHTLFVKLVFKDSKFRIINEKRVNLKNTLIILALNPNIDIISPNDSQKFLLQISLYIR